MMGRTHLIGGIAALWVVEPFLPYWDENAFGFLVYGTVVGSLLPDLDASESLIRHAGFGHGVHRIEPLQPLGWWLNRSFGHRGLVHSLFGLGVASVLFLPVGAWISPFIVLGLGLGFASHLGLDGLTKSGVPLWAKPQWKKPFRRPRRVHLLPPGWRVSTGSPGEEVVFVLLAVSVLTLLLRHLAMPP
jgi:membrane-bound metal-dependent hydrolase YbcI (DUF457 family)